MKLRALVAAVSMAMIILGASAAHGNAPPPYRIQKDYGGSVDAYYDRYTAIRNSGRQVVVDGMCISACTLVMALVDHDKTCITPRARMGFHSAWKMVDGVPTYSSEGTRFVWVTYPREVRAMLVRLGWSGGEHPEMVYAELEDLEKFYRYCTYEEIAEANRSVQSFTGQLTTDSSRMCQMPEVKVMEVMYENGFVLARRFKTVEELARIRAWVKEKSANALDLEEDTDEVLVFEHPDPAFPVVFFVEMKHGCLNQYFRVPVPTWRTLS